MRGGAVDAVHDVTIDELVMEAPAGSWLCA